MAYVIALVVPAGAQPSRVLAPSAAWVLAHYVRNAACRQDGSVRCVIVDDDERFVNFAQNLLQREGVTVVGVARSRAEALQRVEALRPDVVLIDIRVGEESGFDVARRLADNGPPAALIMISAHLADYAGLIAKSPVAGFVPKAELSASAIHRILGRPEPQVP